MVQNRLLRVAQAIRIPAGVSGEILSRGALSTKQRKYGSGLRIRYVATERNARSASVFESTGLEEDGSSSVNAIVWCYPEGKILPNDELIEIDARAVRRNWLPKYPDDWRTDGEFTTLRSGIACGAGQPSSTRWKNAYVFFIKQTSETQAAHR